MPPTESRAGTDGEEPGDAADRVVVSFRAPAADPEESDSWWTADSAWLSENMNGEPYRLYLRRAHEGPVAVGEEWAEFVNYGCASPEDVLLRVERVEGGTEIGPETAVEVVPRREILEGDGRPAAGDDP